MTLTCSRKADAKSIIGPGGVRDILDELRKARLSIPSVCIGGVNASNIQRVLFTCATASNDRRLAGVAVVSAIMASPNPEQAARDLRGLMDLPPSFESVSILSNPRTEVPGYDILTSDTLECVRRVWLTKPLCHNMTNIVVANMSANIAIAIGGSPIMSDDGNEAADLARLNGSLVVNMGTVTPTALDNYVQAIQAYNDAGNPILLDPVGAGATEVRRNALRRLLSAGYFTVIKGNEAEIKAVWKLSAATASSESEPDDEVQHGVDSGDSKMTTTERTELTVSLARREKCIVLMTGEVDHLSDGRRTISIGNGHAYMGHVTGSGCSLGTTIGAFLAMANKSNDFKVDRLMAVLAGVLLYEIAAEVAAECPGVNGPGTFLPAWLDQLFLMSSACTEELSPEWIRKTKCMTHFMQ
jgi:thiamine-phosphate diphosphorylase / hydroxyethylthiazole kinase